MKQLEVRFLKNNLIVNTNRTVAMSFHLCQLKPPYQLCILLQNTETVYMSEVKFLGMYIMENLSWQAHICSPCHSLSVTYFIIISLKNILSNRMFWSIYFAYFQLRMSTTARNNSKYKGTAYLKKKVIRLITGIKKYESCRQKFKENRILTETSLYVLFFVKKYKGNLKQNFVIQEHNMRSKYDLHTQLCNTTLFQKIVLNTGVKLYKYLPSKIKKSDNFNCFRKEVKLALLNNLFYKPEEFLQAKSV